MAWNTPEKVELPLWSPVGFSPKRHWIWSTVNAHSLKQPVLTQQGEPPGTSPTLLAGAELMRTARDSPRGRRVRDHIADKATGSLVLMERLVVRVDSHQRLS